MTDQLAAERLQSDPRVTQAKLLLVAALNEHRGTIQGVRPPIDSRRQSYEQTLAEFGEVRGGNLYFPYLSSGLGNGAYVELADGSVKLDMITGIGVHGLGHSHPKLLESGIDAAIQDTVLQGNLQQSDSNLHLTKMLLELANAHGGQLDHCILSTSGAMANENALKLAFHHRPGAQRVLAFQHCFAGRTLALSQLTDKAAYRVGLPEIIQVDYLPFYDPQDPAGSTERCLNVLDQHLRRYPDRYAAIWMELIQGEGGYYPGETSFFEALIKRVAEHKIIVAIDEVQTFARTTQPYAFQHFGLDSLVDIVTIGKISQVCATLYRGALKPKPGLISQTFTGGTWEMLAARTILQELLDRGHFGPNGRNAQLHDYFAQGLRQLEEKYPQVIQGPFGLGGMVAFTPLDGSPAHAQSMVRSLYDEGLMSFMAGANPTRIRFLMPLGVVTEAEIDEACRIIDRVAANMERESD